VGASAGGVEALVALVSRLPRDTTAALLVVIHMAPHTPSVLPRILARRCALPVRRAEDHHHLVPGEVVVAIPDHHLVVHGHETRTILAPAESGHRPAVDALFRSVARWWGPLAVGVVLTGALDDGSAGLSDIYENGGLALVQDPAEAAVPAMPEHAMGAVPAAEALSIAAIAKRIGELRPAAPRPHDVGDRLHAEAGLVEAGPGASWERAHGQLAGLSCPDCGGPLFDVPDDDLRFRCRVGHAWTARAAVRRNAEEVERALWTAARIIEDDLELQQRIAARAEEGGRHSVARRVSDRIDVRRGTLRSLYELIRDLAGEEVTDD
jgi:two-component system, chemotaxis family, protein-glutamate methylesterase/glutaminase